MPNQHTARPIPPQVRFWSFVEKTDGCWLWQGHRATNGYGRFWIDGRTIPAHRWAYEQAGGLVPPGQELDHLCHNPPCVRPGHVEPVSHRDNVVRGRKNPVALAARATHCPRGHPYDLANTYFNPNHGGRQCRACGRLRNQGNYRRRKILAGSLGIPPWRARGYSLKGVSCE